MGTLVELRAVCDIHEDGHKPRGRCRWCRRYAHLTGFALRTPAEEREVRATQRWLHGLGMDPGWEVVPRQVAR